MKRLLCASFLVAALLSAGRPAQAKIGLSSQFVDVVLENLKPGHSYNIRELKGVPYTVKNRGDSPAEIAVEIVSPSSAECKTPYEPIPDPTWLQVRPAAYRLNAGQPGFSDLVITLPDDPKLAGRHFQAKIWAHTKDTGLLAAGVKSDVRFSVGKGPATLEEERRRKAMVDLDYDFYPAALYVRSARPGPYDVKKEEKRSFKVTNRSEKALDLVLKPIAWQSTVMPLPPGYTALEDVSWIRVEPERLRIEADTVQEVRVTLAAPDAMKGRKVALLMQLSLPIGVIVGASNAVYIEFP